jgi:hypothetical protein
VFRFTAEHLLKTLLKEEETMKKSIIAFLKGIFPVIIAFVFVVSVSGCQKKEEGPMEKAGKEIDKSVEATKDTVQQAGEKVKEGAEKTKEAVETGAQKAADTVKEGAEKTKEAVQSGAQKAADTVKK